MLYFCRRGRPNLSQLKKVCLHLRNRFNRCKIRVESCEELTKNLRENDKGEDGGAMYAT